MKPVKNRKYYRKCLNNFGADYSWHKWEYYFTRTENVEIFVCKE